MSSIELMLKQANFVYAAGETRRFHSWPVLREQNVADHSWHVAMLAYVLYGQQEPGVRPAFLMALLTHDMAECRMGDIPSPAKRILGETLGLEGGAAAFKEQWDKAEQVLLEKFGFDYEVLLDEEELRRFKLCDAFEGAFYCVRERAMGNKLIVEPFINFNIYIKEKLMVGDYDDDSIYAREWELYRFLCDEWEKASGTYNGK